MPMAVLKHTRAPADRTGNAPLRRYIYNVNQATLPVKAGVAHSAL